MNPSSKLTAVVDRIFNLKQTTSNGSTKPNANSEKLSAPSPVANSMDESRAIAKHDSTGELREEENLQDSNASIFLEGIKNNWVNPTDDSPDARVMIPDSQSETSLSLSSSVKTSAIADPPNVSRLIIEVPVEEAPVHHPTDYDQVLESMLKTQREHIQHQQEMEKKMIQLQQSLRDHRKQDDQKYQSKVQLLEKQISTERSKNQELALSMQKSQRENQELHQREQAYKDTITSLRKELSTTKEKSEKIQ